MTVVIRLDVTPAIGTGHLRRMAVIARELTFCSVHFVVFTDQPEIDLLSEFDVTLLKAGDDPDELESILRELEPAAIIFDLLRYKQGHFQRIREIFPTLKMVAFHEYQDFQPETDLAVNFNLVDIRSGQQQPQKLLSSPDYCIIDDRIRTLEMDENADSVFCFFGGSDPSGFLSKFINEYERRRCKFRGVVHYGALAPYYKEMEACTLPGGLCRSSEAGGFFRALSGSKGALVAAGNIMYEFIYLGIKPLVLAHNEHQSTFAANAADMGLCNYFGQGTAIDWDFVFALLTDDCRSFAADRNETNIDGMGAKRLASELFELVS
jgi:spore coat polysaccharide biosynthesis predicted glycosyltransferase SpsG